MAQFELLEGLPGYGPMYVPIASNAEPFYSEGFVLRLFPKDGEPWVANLRPGLNSFNAVLDFPEHNKVVIIAGGEGYVLDPTRHHSLIDFGAQIEHTLTVDDYAVLFVDLVGITVLFLSTGELWKSERISWDGMRNLIVQGKRVHGESWQPGRSDEKWDPFTLDLESKHVTGGSYSGLKGRLPFHREPVSLCPSIWLL